MRRYVVCKVCHREVWQDQGWGPFALRFCICEGCGAHLDDHAWDCAINTEPYYKSGPCDCGVIL